jgi:hypothetical protein
VRCGEERRAVGKTGLGLLRDIPTRSGEPQDRSPGPLRASAAPRQTLSKVTLDRVGKGLIMCLTQTGAGMAMPVSTPKRGCGKRAKAE